MSTITTQRTSKLLKFLLIAFPLVCLYGVFQMVVSASDPAFVSSMENMQPHKSIGGFFAGIGITIFGAFCLCVTRFLIWWNHH